MTIYSQICLIPARFWYWNIFHGHRGFGAFSGLKYTLQGIRPNGTISVLDIYRTFKTVGIIGLCNKFKSVDKSRKRSILTWLERSWSYIDIKSARLIVGTRIALFPINSRLHHHVSFQTGIHWDKPSTKKCMLNRDLASYVRSGKKDNGSKNSTSMTLMIQLPYNQ